MAVATNGHGSEPEVVGKVFAFIFPMAAGHINPSLPVARTLVAAGHVVHYLCREQMREAIEDTGARFHADVEVERELFNGRSPDTFGALFSLAKEHGLLGISLMELRAMLRHVQVELQLPGLLRWLGEIGAQGVMYDPIFCPEAAYGARLLGLESVALLTIAGPGAMEPTEAGFMKVLGLTREGVAERTSNFEPGHAAVARLRATYGLDLDESSASRPVGYMDILSFSCMTLVTTSETLQEPMSRELAEAYRAAAVRFDFVGPLLDGAGAKRAAAHRFNVDEASDHRAEDIDVADLVRRAKGAGRRVVLVSMGTVVTGDSPEHGWDGRRTASDGTRRGLCGRELCHAAWQGAFDALGEERAEDGAFLVVALGPQKDPLGAIMPPPNAVCRPVLQQVDILRAGVDVFVTHAGQNSFMEGLAAGAALVCCPSFADQPVNARRAENLGLGLQVPRPEPQPGDEAAAAAAYRADVARALGRVLREPGFMAAARECAADLARAPGVPRAAEWMVAAASRPAGALASSGKEPPAIPEVAAHKLVHGGA